MAAVSIPKELLEEDRIDELNILLDKLLATKKLINICIKS